LRSDVHLMVDVALTTGLRWGELSALRVGDLSWQAGDERVLNVHVVRAWSERDRRYETDPIGEAEGESVRYNLGPTKSRKDRWVQVSGDLAESLWASRVLARQPIVDLAVSNIRGGRDPLYLWDSRLLRLSPFITGVSNIALIVGVLSYINDSESGSPSIRMPSENRNPSWATCERQRPSSQSSLDEYCSGGPRRTRLLALMLLAAPLGRGRRSRVAMVPGARRPTERRRTRLRRSANPETRKYLSGTIGLRTAGSQDGKCHVIAGNGGLRGEREPGDQHQAQAEPGQPPSTWSRVTVNTGKIDL
jgi:hypothetical protein